MAKDEKVPDNKQCEEGKLPAGRPRHRGQEVLPGILGKQLKAAYGELLNAPVPDAITELIKQLEDKEPSPAAGSRQAAARGERSVKAGLRTRRFAMTSWRQFPTCARSRSRCAATATAPTISCRKHW